MSKTILKNFIGGKHIVSKSGRTFEVKNPATQKVVCLAQDSNVDDMEVAVKAARDAFPEWSKTLARERATLLRKVAKGLNDKTDLFAKCIAEDMAKPVTEAKGEVAYAASYFDWFAEEAKRAYGETIPAPKGGALAMTTLHPVGVVACITPWNFPVGMLARKVAAALAAGCTVVAKPAEHSPQAALALCDVLHDSGLPAGVVNVLTSHTNSHDIGNGLARHKGVDKLTFTGSTAAGAGLAEKAATTVKRVSMELGGNAPFIVLADADLDVAVKQCIASRFRNTGQTCVCANRMFVHEDVADEFISKLKKEVESLKLGDPLDPKVQVSALISQTAVDRVAKLVDEAREAGAMIVCGGKKLDDVSGCAGGTFYAPTIVDKVPHSCSLAEEEIFGPVVAIQRVKSADEAVELANSSEHGLAGYVFTQSLENAMNVSQRLEVGMVAVNDGMVSSEVAPFGGVKRSGYGREGSRHGLADYTNLKYTLINYNPPK